MQQLVQVHLKFFLYLSGVNSLNLGFILDYIYYGEVNIYQGQLESFLESAQKLEIEGLLGGTEESQENETNIIENNENDNSSIKELFLTMMNENKELISMLKDQKESHDKQISEIIPKIGNTNNSFNIQIFLNESCKDALNIDDFVKNIDINLDDLDYTKNNGLVEGISNAIIQNMSKLKCK